MSDSHRSRAEAGVEPLAQEIEKNLLIQQAINAILRISLEQISLDEQMHRVLDLLLKLPWLALEAQGCIFLVENDSSALVMKAHIGMSAGVRSTCSRVPFGTCLCGRAIADNEMVFASGVDECHTILYPGIQPHGHYCLPIACGGRRVGLLNLYVREGHERSPTEERFLRAVAGVLAGIIEHQRTQERLREQLRLAAFGRDVGLTMSQGDCLPDMLRQCAEALVRHLDGAFARIWTLNEAENVLELQASAGLYTHIDGAHSRVPVGQYKIGLIAQERKPHLTNAVLADPRVHDHEWAKRQGLVAFAGYPLLVEDRLMGVMAMFARQPLSAATLDAMASVANGIAVGIERKRTHERLLRMFIESKESERRLAVEHGVSHILAESETLGDAALKIIQAVCKNLDWDAGTLWLVDRNAKVLRCVEVWHTPAVEMSGFKQDTYQRTFSSGRGMPGRVWASDTLVWVPDVTSDADFPRAPIAASVGLHGAVGFPIRKGNEIIGVIDFFSNQIRQPDKALIEMMTSLGVQISQFIERKQSERRLFAEHSVCRILGEFATITDAAPKVIQVICENLEWDVGALWLLDRDANVLRCVETGHRAGVESAAFECVSRQRTFTPGVGLPGRVWASQSSVWIGDVTGDSNFPRALIAVVEGLHKALGFPICLGTEFFGVMEFFSREIRQPDEALMEMMTNLGSQIGQFIERRKTQEELQRQAEDRRIARQIQQGLLPKAMPTLPGFRISGRSLSANDVGGDCFDFIPFSVEGQECLGVLVADASGHGIAAALLMAKTRAYLRALAMTYTGVDNLLTFTNRRLTADLVTDHFVSLFLVQLNPRTRSLVYANAGHRPGYVLDRQGEIKTVLASTGGLVGIDQASEFATGTTMRLESGELVFLYTDGIVEAMSRDGRLFGLESTLNLVRGHRNKTPDEIVDKLFDAVSAFSEGNIQDDLTAVIIKAEGTA